MDYDVLVVGSGIGGMESALKLGDMGYRVLLVEKEPSVGGKMILLSKVFPTLDCASCISTPKMAAASHHPNVTVLTDAEVEGITRDGDGRFHATIEQKPRFVDTALCTGCQQCELACTVAVPDQFNGGLVARRAAYIAFPQAVPKKARDRARGHVAVHVRLPGRDQGARLRLARAQRRVREGVQPRARDDAARRQPRPRLLRAVRGQCTRGSLEGTLPIRRIKRFVADAHYAAGGEPGVEAAEPNGKRVAVVGSGPAGLTAAWQLPARATA